MPCRAVGGHLRRGQPFLRWHMRCRPLLSSRLDKPHGRALPRGHLQRSRGRRCCCCVCYLRSRQLLPGGFSAAAGVHLDAHHSISGRLQPWRLRLQGRLVCAGHRRWAKCHFSVRHLSGRSCELHPTRHHHRPAAAQAWILAREQHLDQTPTL